MKLLNISHRVPYPLKDGGAIMIYNFLKGYKKLGIETHFVGIAAKKHQINLIHARAKLEKLAKVYFFKLDTDVKLWGALIHLINRKSYNITRFYHPELARYIKDKLDQEEFDAIQFETIFMASYLPIVRSMTKAPCVLRQHNMESEIWERRAKSEKNKIKKAYLLHLTKRLHQFEKENIPLFDSIVWVTENDREKGKVCSAQSTNYVVPSGIEIPQKTTINKINSNKWYHLGALDWPANIDSLQWFLKNIWPTLLQKNKEIELHIAGRNCPGFLKKMKLDKVYIHGEVEDKEMFLKDKSICLIPIKAGSGIRIKLLEAVAQGKVIVSTHIGCQGIPEELLKTTVVANDLGEFLLAKKEIEKIETKTIEQMRDKLKKLYSIENTALQMAKIIFPNQAFTSKK